VFINDSNTKPAGHFAINLGAPGDMRDSQGTLWFGYPRPKTYYGKYGVRFDLQTTIADGMEYFRSNYKGIDIAGSDKPWLFASGCMGLLQCQIPLADKTTKNPAGNYTVRLGFAAPPGDKPAQRIFDIKLQGNIVLKDFDIVKTVGGSNTAVIKEFKKIAVTDVLNLELDPKTEKPDSSQAPVVNFIEVIAEKD